MSKRRRSTDFKGAPPLPKVSKRKSKRGVEDDDLHDLVDLTDDFDSSDNKMMGGKKTASTKGGGVNSTSTKPSISIRRTRNSSEERQEEESRSKRKKTSTELPGPPLPVMPQCGYNVFDLGSDSDESTGCHVPNSEKNGQASRHPTSATNTAGVAAGALPQQHIFKRPDLPVSRPAAADTSSDSKDGVKGEPTEKQLEITGKSRDMRTAVIYVIHEQLDHISGGVTSQINELLSNISTCLKQMPNTFAKKRYPGGEHVEDLSSRRELKEFAQWWLSGLAALLFASPTEIGMAEKDEIKSLIRRLCQRLCNGHPQIVADLTPTILRLIRDLTAPARSGQDFEKVLKLSLPSHEGGVKKKVSFNIKFQEGNEWAIPHFLEAISILFPRIYFFNPKMRHLLLELMGRILSNENLSSVGAVLSGLSCCLMPATNHLTEDTMVRLFQQILIEPCSNTIDAENLHVLFSRYDILHNGAYGTWLQDWGLALLETRISEAFQSQNVDLPLGGCNDVARTVLKRIGAGCSMGSTLVARFGFDVMGNPLFEKKLLQDLKQDHILQQTRRVIARQVSPLWKALLERWESCLASVRQPIINQQQRCNEAAFLRSTCLLMKMVRRVTKELESETKPAVLYEFLELRHFQQWSDVVFRALSIISTLTLNEARELYSAVLDTLIEFDACQWFEIKLPAPLKSHLLSIPGWPWLAKFDNRLPRKFRPFKEFTKHDCQFILSSKLQVAQCTHALRLEIFRPWNHFVLSVYDLLIKDSDSTLDNNFLVAQLLNGIADVGWPFKELSLKTVFLVPVGVIEKDLWRTDPGVRTSLGAAIVSLPCICYHSVVRGQSTSLSAPAKSGCLHCVSDAETGFQGNVELPGSYINSIMTVVAPLLSSRFLLVKTALTELIARCRNHMKVPSPTVVLLFVQAAVGGKLSLCEEVFHKIGILLSEENDINSVCPDRLAVAQKVFSALPLMVTQAKEPGKMPLSIYTKILKGFLRLVSCSISVSVFIELVKCMIRFLVRTDKSEVTMLCQKIMTKCAAIYQCPPSELMARVRLEISQEIIKVSIKAFYKRKQGDEELADAQKCADFLGRLLVLGEFRSPKLFIQCFYPTMLEAVVPKLHTEPGCRFILLAMKTQANELEQVLLEEWVMNYYPTLLLDHSSDTVSNCLQFLKRFYAFDAMFAAMQQEQRILNEALCRLHDREDKVLRCLPHLCQWDDESSQMMYSTGTSKLPTRSEIQELLGKRLLGFFLHLDTKLHSRIETVEAKKKIIKSFTALIKVVGKNKISPLRSKVYKTLNSMTEEGAAEYAEVLYEAWKAFAYNLDNNCVGPMTSQILAALLPLRSTSMRPQVDGLIAHFVCFKSQLTSAFHHELYFLIDQCDDQLVVDTISKTVNRIKAKNWAEYFQILVKELSHDNYHLRSLAFKKLRDVFRFDSELVARFILTKAPQQVPQVLEALLTGLRGDSDDKLRFLIVECFGYLGALDPVRFRNSDDNNFGWKPHVGWTISGQMASFGLPFVQELIREFQEAKDTTNFDYCACLIQEVLQEFKVQPTKNDPIWGQLGEAYQELIAPLLKTKYTMEYKQPLGNVTCPIYLSDHGRTFDSWLLTWLTVLISHVSNAEPQAFSLLNRIKYLLRRNPRIANYIIPHVAMYAIFCGSTDQREEMVTEITAVLEQWTIIGALKAKSHSIEPVKDSQAELGVPPDDTQVDNDSVFHFRCTQVVFNILDHLLRSYRLTKRRWGLKKANDQFNRSSKSVTPPPMSEANMAAVESVLNRVPKNLISQVAFDCEWYATALFYLEQEIGCDSSKEKLQQNLGYLQRLYVSLNDMDSVVGISSVRDGNPSICEVILENAATGKIMDSVRNLEKMTSLDPINLFAHNALVQAYLNLEEPWKADILIRGTLQKRPEWEMTLEGVQMEALVKLKEWTDLRHHVERLEKPCENLAIEDKRFEWNIATARIISKIECEKFDDAMNLVEKIRTKLVTPLVAASEEMDSYKRGYISIVQLHILAELEEGLKLLKKHCNLIAIGKGASTQNALLKDVERMLSKWDDRVKNVTRTRKVVDQILNARKSLFEIMKTAFRSSPKTCDQLNSSIRECWLDIARDASKCGNFIRADNCLTEAKKYMSPKVFIQEAKIFSRKGEKETALQVLQAGIDLYFPERDAWKSTGDGSGTSSTSSTIPLTTFVAEADKKLCSKALLLFAKLCEEQKLLNMEDYIAKYKEAVDVYKDSEKNYFTLGSYHDRLWSASDRKDKEIQVTVVRYYSQSLFHGCKYVYQSLPRLLSIWFDFAAEVHNDHVNGKNKASNRTSNSTSSSSSSSRTSSTSPREKMTVEAILEEMNVSIKKLVTTIPAYVLMTAFSQLVSRLCHSNQETWTRLKDIIVSIICTHPHQALWMTIAVSKSVNKRRRSRCLEIYKSVENKKPELKNAIRDYTMLSENFIELCDKHIDRSLSKASLKSLHKGIPNLIRSTSFGKVSIPFQIFLNPTLPRIGLNHREHEPFPEKLVYINDIDDNVDVMLSLIRPKKVVLRASDGKAYGLMCKPKDDLRKDSKVMEVNNVVNWYLSQNTESSQRNLHVRTFSVVPLNEECGLLEWVPNLTGFRFILLSLYKERGITRWNFKDSIDLRDPLPEKRSKFEEKFLKPTPPVFREWFFNNFNTYQSWYAARMAYVRTAAVMSIVGYIMGLGDRHGENILVDSVTGEVVHVDFNCLFNKGETFEWIERVPFRLTQNMVDAMGPLGYEGVFRRTCEIVMNMFREHKSIFLSILRPFVFDPLVEWAWDTTTRKAISYGATCGEVTNEKAVETMKYIRHRLSGTARNLMRDINTELSVEAMVRFLIDEASSIDNLCQMYIGWAAYL